MLKQGAVPRPPKSKDQCGLAETQSSRAQRRRNLELHALEGQRCGVKLVDLDVFEYLRIQRTDRC